MEAQRSSLRSHTRLFLYCLRALVHQRSTSIRRLLEALRLHLLQVNKGDAVALPLEFCPSHPRPQKNHLNDCVVLNSIARWAPGKALCSRLANA